MFVSIKLLQSFYCVSWYLEIGLKIRDPSENTAQIREYDEIYFI